MFKTGMGGESISRSRITLCFGLMLLLLACRGEEKVSEDRPQQPEERVRIRRIQPIWDFYTGVLLEITGPGNNQFWLWPQEYWSWISEDGIRQGGFVQDEYIQDFRQDAETGTVSYTLTMGPQDCETRVSLVPGVDFISIIHEIENRGSGTLLGGSPCLQIGRAKDFQSWTFEQAKRTFLWTVRDGFVWLSDTRRRGKDVHVSNKPFCQNYHLRDPTKMHKAFGRSPDLATAGLIGAVSLDGKWLVACMSENAQSVAHGLMNCLHSSLNCQTGPGETGRFLYHIYFLENDVPELTGRVASDFPNLLVPPPESEEFILAGQPPPLESFEDRKSYPRVRCLRSTLESTWVRKLSLWQGAAPTYGVTHGHGAALCDFQEGGQISIERLFRRAPGNEYFTIDLTLPEDQNRAFRITLRQGQKVESRNFELFPGATRRCVVPLGRIEPVEPVDFTLEPADGRHCLLQLDCVCLY